MKTIRFILSNLDQFRWRFFVVFTLGTIDGFVSFLIFVALAEFTRKEFSLASFYLLISLVAAGLVAMLFFQWVIRKYGESLAPQFADHLRTKYFDAVEKLPPEKLGQRHSGYVLSLVNKITGTANRLTTFAFWALSHSISTLILFFIFTARESVPIAFLNLVVLVLFMAINFFLSKKVVLLASELNLKRAELIGHYTDFMSNILTIKKLGIASFAKGRLEESTGENYRQIEKFYNFHARRWSLLHFIFEISLYSTIVFLLYRVVIGADSPAILILFIAAYARLRRLVDNFSQQMSTVMEMNAYLDDLGEIVTIGSRSEEKKERSFAWNRIELKDIRFQHPGNRHIIKVPEFSLSKGEKACFFGVSGEGKTTILNLLGNFLANQKGQRLVDGKQYEEAGAGFFSQKMVMVSQEVELFNLSIRENIALGKKIHYKEIEKALQELDLLAWSKKLKDGLDTLVGEKGIRLSAGQKQRLNLIRGVLLDREIYLLDEPTSHLDSQTEQKVVEFIRKRLKDKTVVIVSHRPAVRQVCDTLYSMEGHVLRKE